MTDPNSDRSWFAWVSPVPRPLSIVMIACGGYLIGWGMEGSFSDPTVMGMGLLRYWSAGSAALGALIQELKS